MIYQDTRLQNLYTKRLSARVISKNKVSSDLSRWASSGVQVHVPVSSKKIVLFFLTERYRPVVGTSRWFTQVFYHWAILERRCIMKVRCNRRDPRKSNRVGQRLAVLVVHALHRSSRAGRYGRNLIGTTQSCFELYLGVFVGASVTCARRRYNNYQQAH